ncbi:hypothetical protein Cni_G23629 [Canna indica]|uniref:Uncharacterized protein n=1 Tax=Canna indica TaxID=4628 RepID=A0AAQ3QME5_9LILI|nr:hypothetical protein Cni_G23629 [Canna indica]
MECQAGDRKKETGRPLPRRGQVKARIFGGLVRAVIPKALKNGGKHKGNDGGGGGGGGDRSSADVTPAMSGYTSSFDED